MFLNMEAVSCKSATYCLATGLDGTNGGSGINRSFALIWNGTQVSAAPLPPVPAGGVDTELAGVTCLAVKSCVAGGTSLGSGGGTKLVFDTWNGAKWTMHAQVATKGAAFVNATGLSCVSLSYCVLAGESSTITAITTAPYLASWNGKTATAMKVPVPAGFTSSGIFGVSCATASSCAATGDYIGTGSTPKVTAFTETWNGKAWTAHKFAWPAADPISLLEGVSCTFSKAAGTHCVAVGGIGTESTGAPMAVSWNGKAWTALKVPALGAGESGSLQGVSCPSAKQCAAMGSVLVTNGAPWTPLAGLWNGSVWKLAAA
jgi:hypothetical protein